MSVERIVVWRRDGTMRDSWLACFWSRWFTRPFGERDLWLEMKTEEQVMGRKLSSAEVERIKREVEPVSRDLPTANSVAYWRSRAMCAEQELRVMEKRAVAAEGKLEEDAEADPWGGAGKRALVEGAVRAGVITAAVGAEMLREAD